MNIRRSESALWIWLCLSVRPFATENLRIGLSVFLIFCIKLQRHKIKKVRDPNFEKKFLRVRRVQTVPKMKFLGFRKKLTHSYEFFLLHYESTNFLLTFCKNHIIARNLVLSSGPKTSRTVKMQHEVDILYATRHP